MSELILHHYDSSPFAQKVRSILGYKNLDWRSVEIPIAMPKPDLVALTGGYRKTPVLQIGSDVYCDTLLIARTLDRLHPERPVFRPEHALDGVAAGRWLDHQLFFAVIAQVFDPAVVASSMSLFATGSSGAADFAKDRAAMMANASVRRPPLPEAKAMFASLVRDIEGQLAARGAFLSGSAPGWIDFCAYHPLWMLQRIPALRSRLDSHAELSAWLERMNLLGQGTQKGLTAAEALEIARADQAEELRDPVGEAPDGLSIGTRIAVSATDYALEASEGRLVAYSTDEIVITRSDPRAGEVRVHFPRIGFDARASQQAAT